MNRFFTLLLAASCLTAVGQTEYCLDGTVWDEEYEVFVFAEELRRQGAKLHGRSLWLAAKYIHTSYRADDAWHLPHQDEWDLPEDELVPSLEDNIALYVETYMIEELLP